MLSPKEQTLWSKKIDERAEKTTDSAINDRYVRGDGRIVIETNREKLPGFVSASLAPGYMDIQPSYQRRPRWKTARKSLLIESFIMNIPVPPVFLYERQFNSYEVMDGQQRITALREFYADKFELEGLETWSELNGRTYSRLPDQVRAGLDRRSITSIVVLRESTADEDEAAFLRETVFQRLNTGGVALSRQEMRNALYPSAFNDLLFVLSRIDRFRQAWGIPLWVENEIEANPAILDNTLFARMDDLELVLRFFALRHVAHYRNGMQGFLDIFMRKAMAFEVGDISDLEAHFSETLDAASSIFGDLLFRPFSKTNNSWEPKPQKAFADAVMVGLSRQLEHKSNLIARKDAVIESTAELFRQHEQGTFTGRGNSKLDIETRINLFEQMLIQSLG